MIRARAVGNAVYLEMFGNGEDDSFWQTESHKSAVFQADRINHALAMQRRNCARVVLRGELGNEVSHEDREAIAALVAACDAS